MLRLSLFCNVKPLLHISIGIWCFLTSVQLYAANPRHAEELWQALIQAQHIDEKTKLYAEISRAYISVNIDSAQWIAQEGIALCRQAGSDKHLARLYNALAVAAISGGQGDLAIHYMDSAIYYDEKTENNAGLAGSLGNKGSVLYMLGRYSEAQKLQFRALKLYEVIGDKSAIATTWSNIHGTYFILKDWDNALKSAHLALSYFKDLGEKDGIAVMAYDLGCVYIETHQIDSAEFYANLCLDLYEELQQTEGIADGNRILADVYRGKGNLDAARQLVMDAISTYEQIGAQFKKVQSQILLANIEFERQNLHESWDYLEMALPECRSMGSRQLIRDILKLKMEILSIQKNYEAYYAVAKEFIPLKDSILNEESIEAIKRVESEYELERHIRENESLKQQQEILELELHKKNTRIIVWSLLLILIILSAYWYTRARKQKQIQHTLELRQQLLQSQMNPHFVFNSLSAIQSFMYANEPLKAARFLSSFATLMRGILDHSAAGWIFLEKECAWLNKYLEIQQLRFEGKFEYDIEMDDQIIPSQTKVPAMLIQPFVENSIEHGFKNIQHTGKIHISFTKINNKLEVTVKDNGNGFENSPTQDAQEKIHAMKITKERLTILNRELQNRIELHVKSLPQGGTEIKFLLPLIEQ